MRGSRCHSLRWMLSWVVSRGRCGHHLAVSKRQHYGIEQAFHSCGQATRSRTAQVFLLVTVQPASNCCHAWHGRLNVTPLAQLSRHWRLKFLAASGQLTVQLSTHMPRGATSGSTPRAPPNLPAHPSRWWAGAFGLAALLQRLFCLLCWRLTTAVVLYARTLGLANMP
jgi:hypothetical protein